LLMLAQTRATARVDPTMITKYRFRTAEFIMLLQLSGVCAGHRFPIPLEASWSGITWTVVSAITQHQRPCWTPAFTPPWISPACPRSFRIRAGYLTRSCPPEHTGWNVLPWTSDSPTTLRVCSSADGPGLLHRGVPPQASPIQPLAGQGVRSPGLPPPLCHVARRRTYLVHAFYATPETSVCQGVWAVAMLSESKGVLRIAGPRRLSRFLSSLQIRRYNHEFCRSCSGCFDCIAPLEG
jgi:hypothetical protein